MGRNRGYGLTLVTQRAAAVDKHVLTQCGSLLLLRIAAEIDRKAITGWIADTSTSGIDMRRVWDELCELPNGTGWLWSPTWGNKLTRVKIATRTTFHPSPDNQDAKMCAPAQVAPQQRKRPVAAPAQPFSLKWRLVAPLVGVAFLAVFNKSCTVFTIGTVAVVLWALYSYGVSFEDRSHK
ncbi:MAG: hypothetical protein A2341_06490 [Deltaproteobacteria bacterium RIFOXYB12_FULL_58_9]|nr:MAG: hypothetical protein A2341_06490 [Deltaproteobacteria bacterium RIFOXYB12_FULL_58_9]